MAKDIIFRGIEYYNTPSVELPQIGGGYAKFDDPFIKSAVIRPDAELVKTYAYDKLIHQDEEITIPAYTTTATTLKATEDLGTYTLDYANYNYYVVERMLTIPSYSVATVAKGRCEYHIASHIYEIAEVLANEFITLDGSAKKYTSRTVSLPVSAFYREFYWSAATTVTVYSTAAYSTYQVVTAPAVSSGTLTVKSPALTIRGHATYLSSTYFNAITDIRYQYVIEIWRSPKNHLNLDGYGQTTNLKHIMDCVNSNNKKLT